MLKHSKIPYKFTYSLNKSQNPLIFVFPLRKTKGKNKNKKLSREPNKPTMGRRKIEMKMVVDNSCRQVTFSKRRTGLFKKANELATLCGAEVAVVVFSPGGKPFSFGQPTVESVADRFLSSESDPPKKGSKKIKKEKAEAERLTEQLNELTKELEEEKKRGDAMDEEIREAKAKTNIDLDELGLGGLEALKKSLEDLREKAKERVGEIEASSTLLMLSNDFRSA